MKLAAIYARHHDESDRFVRGLVRHPVGRVVVGLIIVGQARELFGTVRIFVEELRAAAAVRDASRVDDAFVAVAEDRRDTTFVDPDDEPDRAPAS